VKKESVILKEGESHHSSSELNHLSSSEESPEVLMKRESFEKAGKRSAPHKKRNIEEAEDCDDALLQRYGKGMQDHI
jgi:hypothetical protein